MQDTWYVLEDGSSADPSEVAPDAKGVLRHKSGMAVAIGDHGNPRSRGVDAEAERAKTVVKDKPKDVPKPKDMKAQESKPGYTTRDAKTD